MKKNIILGQPIVFIFLQGLHHLYHMASVAFELSKIQKDYPVQILSVTDEHTQALKEIAQGYSGQSCEIITLKLPFRFQYFNYKNKSYPSTLDSFKKSIPYLEKAGVIVSTSHPTPNHLKRLGITRPITIYQAHGCGDREYGFEPSLRKYDFLLISGKNHQERLARDGNIDPSKTDIVGYPKLDNKVSVKGLRQQLFKQNRQIVYYAPHWEPEFTSYKKWGKAILEYFRNSEKYNLIFAPHLLLKHWSSRYKYDLNIKDYQTTNIHIDFGSKYSIDTSYSQIADIYLGDVSSLIYEWIAFKPRPAVFLNTHGVSWQNNTNYRHWEYGPVIDKIVDLQEAIEISGQSQWLELQAEKIKHYMDIQDEPSSLRAAKAIKRRIDGLKKDLSSVQDQSSLK